MKSFKKFLALFFAIVLATSVFSACKIGKIVSNKSSGSSSRSSSSKSYSSYSSRKSSSSSRVMADEDIFVFNNNIITGLTTYGKTLQHITIPQKLNNVTINGIGAGAFKELTNLQSITFGNNIKSLGEGAFKYINSQFTTLYYNGTMDDWVDMYVYDGYANPLNYAENFYLNNQLVTEITISSASYISANAFYGADFKKIKIGSSVKQVGKNAFYNCTSIEEVVCLGDIDSWAQIIFDNECANPLYYAKRFFVKDEVVTEVNLQNTVAIGSYAFAGAPVKRITLGDNVTTIGGYAFCNSKIARVTIGAGVEDFGLYSFERCMSLVEVYNKSNIEITADNTLIFGQYNDAGNRTMVKNICTQESNSKITMDSNGFGVYNDGTNVILLWYDGEENYITLPSNITTINRCAFFGDNKINSVTLRNSVNSILESAFSDCSELSSVNLSSCQSIGRYAFRNCKRLSMITVPSSVEEIGYGAFSGSGLAIATFEVTAGWTAYDTLDSSSTRNILEKDLMNSTTAAQYLRSTYSSKYWRNYSN